MRPTRSLLRATPLRWLRLPVLASLLLAAPLSGQAQDQTRSVVTESLFNEVNVNDMVGPIVLRDESLTQVLDLIGRWTNRTIIRPQALPATTYTLSLPKPVSRIEAMTAIETLLNMNGVALTPMGQKFIKVSALNLARTESPQLIEGSTLGLPASGKIAAKLFTLEFLRAAEFVPQASALLNPAIGAAPVVFEKANTVMIVDSISNLQRIEILLKSVDRPVMAGIAPKFYTLQNAKASDVVTKLKTVITGPLQTQFSSTTSFNADDRTNKIILISDPREHPFFDSLIAQFDVRADPNVRNDIIYLNHANAPDVASLLSQLVSGQTTAASTGSGSSSGQQSGSRLSTRNAAGQPGQPSQPGQPAPAAQAAATAVVQNAAATEEFSDQLTILADERSNAIVVSGTSDDIRLLKELITKIDVLLAQVRIEVVIVDVTLSDKATSGISSLGLRVEGGKLTGVVGTAAGGTISGDVPDPSDPLSGGFADVGSSLKDLNAVIGLTSTPRKSNSNILSMPAIVTSHNKEATIFVGETRPVISGTTSAASGATSGLTTSSSVTQQEIGITLTVLPLIGPDGSIQLEVSQKVEDVLGTITIDGNEQPRIGRRTTESFVSVNNGDIIVLGGLQRSTKSKSNSRFGPIPVIGDIIGFIIGSRSREDTRNELVFLLRPVVLTNTPVDNIETFERIDAGPQKKAVRKIIDREPAAVTQRKAAAAGPAAQAQ